MTARPHQMSEDEILREHEGAQVRVLEEEGPRTTVARVGERRTAIQGMDAGAGVQPMELIRFALESKTPAAELAQLVTLAEHVEERNARKAFFEALRKFQQECPPIKKNKTARITDEGRRSYSYELRGAGRDRAPRESRILDANDLAYNFDTTVDDKGVLLTNICTLRHVLGHAERSSFTLPTSSESAMTAQQRFSAANNFAKRQTLANVLGISITGKEVPDAEIDPATIDEDQAIQIEDLLRESGAPRQKFFEWLDVDSVVAIRLADYPRAVATLRDRIEKKKEKGS
jgi:hypothetical protein